MFEILMFSWFRVCVGLHAPPKEWHIYANSLPNNAV
jgi:hypothetical protein